FGAMLFYFPGCWILAKWLPKYTDSLSYLGILLPVIVYLSKVSLLTNNYMKAYRKEKALFIANLSSAALGMGLFALSAYLLNNLYLVLISVVVVVMLNSVVSEIIVAKIIRVRLWLDFILELMMTVGFIICASLLSLWIGLAVYSGIFVIYCAINYKSIRVIFQKIFKKKNVGISMEANADTPAEFSEDE
ncbi:MAG: hypothetical protein K2M82_05975, partial [Lachnospiraceae bacterium]|nr:hypothetical protein [Lachnospiraceae bacterium]